MFECTGAKFTMCSSSLSSHNFFSKSIEMTLANKCFFFLYLERSFLRWSMKMEPITPFPKVTFNPFSTILSTFALTKNPGLTHS
jgi:hypothetical protein